MLAKVRIDGNSPCFKQPFRNVATIPIVLAPGSQEIGSGIRLLRESQLLNLDFELASPTRDVFES